MLPICQKSPGTICESYPPVQWAVLIRTGLICSSRGCTTSDRKSMSPDSSPRKWSSPCSVITFMC